MSTLIDKAVRWAYNDIRKASRGTLSDYIPNAPHWYGQPLPEVASVDAQALITPQRMREVVMKIGTPAACLNATLDYAANVRLAIRNVDTTKPADPDQVAFVEKILRRPNKNDNGLGFKQKLIRDMFTMGMAGIEIEHGKSGKFANLNVLDMARLRLDHDEQGNLLGFNMLDIYGMPISKGNNSPYAWSPDEVIFIKRDPISESRYGHSRVSQLFTYAVIESLIYTYIAQRFTDSNVPRGVMDLGDITETELKRAIDNWNSQADSAHRIMLTGSKGKSSWYPFHYNLKDLEAPALLDAVEAKIMGITGVTKNELGDSQDVSKANGFNLSYTFKKRAIEPILNAICEELTIRFLWDELGMDDLEFYYHEIDSRDELIASEIDKNYLQAGITTIDAVRNRRGDANTEGGGEPMVFTGSAWIPVRLASHFAELQLAAMEAEVQLLQAQIAAAQMSGAGVAPGAGVEAPIMRPPGPGMRFTTPDGAGSSSFRFKLPKAQAPTTGKTQTTRGSKQALQQQGYRKEDAH